MAGYVSLGTVLEAEHAVTRLPKIHKTRRRNPEAILSGRGRTAQGAQGTRVAATLAEADT